MKLICSLMHSRVDYCNSLLAGLPAQSIDHLQSILDASARLACGLHTYDHITPALHDRLHWLPMQQWITYKLCLLTFKEVQGVAPRYIVELCKCVNTIESRRRLRSAAGGQLIAFHRFREKAVRLLRSVGVEQPAYWTETVINYFVILHRIKNFLLSCSLRHWRLRNCFGIGRWR